MSQQPQYMDIHSTQTLKEGLLEYYAFNPHVTDPATQPSDFANILQAHDIHHVIYGCDTGMYDEIKILPLSWWTSECTFRRYLEMKNSPAATVMYEELIQNKGTLWLYKAILRVLPGVIVELVPIWLKTRNRRKLLPFLEFAPLLDCPLLDIRQEFDLLPFVN